MRKILILFLALFFFCFFAQKTLASSSNFSNNYQVTYQVQESGNTHAVFSIDLTNTSADYFASSYKLEMGFSNIQNVTAADADGKIIPKISKTAQGYALSLDFNSHVVGQGKTLRFTIAFDTPDIAAKQGSIWEINIPGVSNQNDFDNFSVRVLVPPSFGKPQYIKPPQPQRTLVFTKEQLGKSGISLAFGDAQTLGFKLTYHLKNANPFPIKTQIALPLTTNYQDVAVENIDPQPTNVTRDANGNWLAEYHLLPGQKKDITAEGSVALFLTPKQQPISDAEIVLYTKEAEYWNTSDSQIKQLAKSLGTPQAIYTYVVKKLTYDFSRVTTNQPRAGAVGVLKNPSSAVCLEFSDLFIALVRAAGIPAREVEGYAMSQSQRQRPLSLVKDILHAWPEYYDFDKKAWVMVDPTWGNTTGGVDYFSTLDFDHFAFVVKGESSTYPIPAGGYKLSDKQNTKDVDVVFINEWKNAAQDAELSYDFPKKAVAGFPINSSLTIRNNGKTMLSSQTAEITASFLRPLNQTVRFSEIPPFGYVTMPVSFEKTPFLTNKTETITIQTSGKTILQRIEISPIFLTEKVLIGGGIVASITAGIFFIARRTRRLLFLKSKK